MGSAFWVILMGGGVYIFLPRCWVVFWVIINAGLLFFFLPNCWVEPVSNETTTAELQSVSRLFAS